MTTLQKTSVAAALVAVALPGLHQYRQAAAVRAQLLALQSRTEELSRGLGQLKNERDQALRVVESLREENQRLGRNTSELMQLRAKLAASLNGPGPGEQASKSADPTVAAARDWLDRLGLLQQRFAQWPGKATPELRLLTPQDWLKEVSAQELNTDEDCRKVMGQLRTAAKTRFAKEVSQALREFTQSSGGQPPSDLANLTPFLSPEVAPLLDGYEIAKPATLALLQSPEAGEAKAWALVERGTFGDDGNALPGGGGLADPDYDLHLVVWPDGYSRHKHPWPLRTKPGSAAP